MDNGDFSVDGVLSDFPITASASISKQILFKIIFIQRIVINAITPFHIFLILLLPHWPKRYKTR